jgi:hypothetical protein
MAGFWFQVISIFSAVAISVVLTYLFMKGWSTLKFRIVTSVFAAFVWLGIVATTQHSFATFLERDPFAFGPGLALFGGITGILVIIWIVLFRFFGQEKT